MPSRHHRHFVLVFAAIVLLSGCAPSPLATRTAAFSTAATAAVKSASAAYGTAEQMHRDTEVALLVAHYDQNKFDTARLDPLLPPEQMKYRTALFRGLTNYAETLAAISSDAPLNTFDQSNTALAASLQQLGQSPGLAAYVKASNYPKDVNLVATAVDALGRALIEHRRSRALPALLQQMQPHIDTLAALLVADIGTPQTNGLRYQIRLDYEQQISMQKDIVRDQKLTGDARQAVIMKMVALYDAEHTADDSLAALADEIMQLSRAHAALAACSAHKPNAAFDVVLSELLATQQQVLGYYKQLPVK